MDVRSALYEAADENGWSQTRVAAAAGMSEAGIRKFYAGDSATLKSDAMMALMKSLPGFARRLGYKAVPIVAEDTKPDAMGVIPGVAA